LKYTLLQNVIQKYYQNESREKERGNKTETEQE